MSKGAIHETFNRALDPLPRDYARLNLSIGCYFDTFGYC